MTAKLIIEQIKGLSIPKGSSETQQTSSLHEAAIMEIFTSSGANDSMKKEPFRNLFYKLTGKTLNETNYSFKTYINHTQIVNIEIEFDKPYIVHQPNGSQNYPDFILFIIPSSKDAIFTTPIECKGIKPKFNNNPPKKNDNCIYICGNTIFNGSLLRSDECIEKYKQFQMKYRELIDSINSDSDYDMHHVQYKVTEFIGKKKPWPPKYFLGKEEENETLNLEKISYFMN
jgi:hypothetical protein